MFLVHIFSATFSEISTCFALLKLFFYSLLNGKKCKSVKKKERTILITGFTLFFLHKKRQENEFFQFSRIFQEVNVFLFDLKNNIFWLVEDLKS